MVLPSLANGVSRIESTDKIAVEFCGDVEVGREFELEDSLDELFGLSLFVSSFANSSQYVQRPSSG